MKNSEKTDDLSKYKEFLETIDGKVSYYRFQDMFPNIDFDETGLMRLGLTVGWISGLLETNHALADKVVLDFFSKLEYLNNYGPVYLCKDTGDDFNKFRNLHVVKEVDRDFVLDSSIAGNHLLIPKFRVSLFDDGEKNSFFINWYILEKNEDGTVATRKTIPGDLYDSIKRENGLYSDSNSKKIWFIPIMNNTADAVYSKNFYGNNGGLIFSGLNSNAGINMWGIHT